MLHVDSKTQWHTKWFLFIDKFWNTRFWNDQNWSAPIRTNVCEYLRVMLLYPILMFNIIFSVYVFLLFAAFIQPILMFGFVNVLVALLWGVGVMAACIAGVAGIYHGSVWFRKSEFGKRFIINRKECVDKKIGFWGLVKQWIIDRHDKVCSIIVIDGGE